MGTLVRCCCIPACVSTIIFDISDIIACNAAMHLMLYAPVLTLRSSWLTMGCALLPFDAVVLPMSGTLRRALAECKAEKEAPESVLPLLAARVRGAVPPTRTSGVWCTQ